MLTQAAAVFVDGRYTLQAAKQVDQKAWSIEPLADPPPENWLTRHLTPGDRVRITITKEPSNDANTETARELP